MSKERELLESVVNLLKSALEDGKPGFLTDMVASVIGDVGEFLGKPQPAPQSEPEAVKLLRTLSTAINSKTLRVETVRTNEAMELTDLMIKIDSFLSRPAGPDWRKLAVDAWEGWQSAQMTKPMYAIRDAIAAEKGGA